jgi:two-component system, NtrC family, response regulator HydG
LKKKVPGLEKPHAVEGIGNDAIEILMNHPWPRNIRELKSALEYAFVNCHEPQIRAQRLPPNVLYGERPPMAATASSFDRDALKRSRLVEALEKSGGHLTRAARILGLSPVTVRNQMKRCNVRIERKTNLGHPVPPLADDPP